GHAGPIAAWHRHDAGDDQHSSARIDAKGTQLNAKSVDVLDRLWLAAVLVDRVDDHVVFAANGDFSSATRTRRKCPIRQVDVFAMGMDMDWPGALLSRWLWIRQSHSDEKRLAPQPYALSLCIDLERVLECMYVELVPPLD